MSTAIGAATAFHGAVVDRRERQDRIGLEIAPAPIGRLPFLVRRIKLDLCVRVPSR